ncbi:MAG: class I SAM-dependent methyltransferase [Bacteroidota bacterium]
MTNIEASREDIIQSRGYRQNIVGDKFALYISNYPVNAQYLLSRIGHPEYVLAELCCSIGVTLEYLSPGFKQLIGVDIDKDILKACEENLHNSGALPNTHLIQGDVFDDAVLTKIDADIVIYDIPFWYEHKQQNRGNLIDKNPPLRPLIQKIEAYITKDIVIFSPPEWEYDRFAQDLGEIEFEHVYINGTHNRNQIYLGNLVRKNGISQIELFS